MQNWFKQVKRASSTQIKGWEMTIYCSFKEQKLRKHRSNHQRCSMQKGVLRDFTKFTGEHLCQSLFFNKVAGLLL